MYIHTSKIKSGMLYTKMSGGITGNIMNTTPLQSEKKLRYSNFEERKCRHTVMQ